MVEASEILKNVKVYETPLFHDNSFIELNSNENQFGTSPKVLRAIKNISQENVSKYPYYGELMSKIAQEFKLEATNVLLTSGCDEAISTVFRTYLNYGDTVISFAPTFAMPAIYAELTGARFEEIEYDRKWLFDKDKIIQRALEANAKIIHITSPNSPTGESVPVPYIEEILQKFPNSAIVVDKTYSSYMLEDDEIEKYIEHYDNLFVVRSFSKDYALAGLRLGYVLTSKENILNLKKIISPYSVNTVATIAGLAALDDKKHLQKIKTQTIRNKRILTLALEASGFKVYRSEGNFILCDMGDKADFIYKKLYANKIKIKKFNDIRLKNCFRITIPNSKDLKTLLEVLTPRDMLVFDMDGVLFDVRNSYRAAIQATFKHFSGKTISEKDIQDAKNYGGLNCDWALTQFLLKQEGLNVEFEEIVRCFQENFFSPHPDGSMGLIDNEEILCTKEFIEKLSHKYDLCIFTGRPEEEALYSLKKYGIIDFFNIIITKNSLPDDKQKPNPLGLQKIRSNSVCNNIIYFGDTKDDMICARLAGATGIGVLPPQDKSWILKRDLKKEGAKKVIRNISRFLWEKFQKKEKQKKLQ